MSIFHPRSWLKRSSRSPRGGEHRRAAGARPAAGARLGVERLEDRVVPSVTLISHYNGIDFNTSQGFVPPDTNGAAGTNSYVETTNQEVGIFSPKDTGTTQVLDSLDDFYFVQGGLAHASPTSGLSDPVVLWDEQIQRFLVCDQDVDFTNHFNTFDIAVSKTATPATLTAADWTFSQINTAEAGFDSDYPGNLGFNHDAFVFTLNEFPTAGGPAHTEIDTVDINALVSGTPLVLGTNAFINDFNGFSLRPTTMHDSVAGDPMWFIEEDGTNAGINVIKMTSVLSAAPTFTTTDIPVTPYSTAVPELNQDGSIITSNTDSRIMKAAMQNGLIVAAHQVANGAGTLDQVQWYVFNTSGGTPTLQQQGDISGGANTYFAYPGIDINPTGDIGISYIASGPATPFPGMSVYVTGRTPADAPGTMEAPVLVQAGQANYHDFDPVPPTGREGDLSGINVDSDGSFWISNEFANTEPFANWGTTIAHFSFPTPITILPFSATEGIPLVNVPVATFSDFSGLPVSSYNATISWGDGTTSAGLVVQGSNSTTFLVEGTHTYSEEGQYTLTVSVSSPQTNFGSVSTTINVADAPLIPTSSGFTFNTTVGNYLSNILLGTFRDTDQTNTPSDPQNNPADYTATIFWQDATGNFVPNAGRIVALGNNTYAVFGDSPFSYPTGGTFNIRVVVQDVGGATAQLSGHVNVAHQPAISPVTPIIPEFQADLGPFGPAFILMEDALTNLLIAERSLYASFFGPVPHQNQVIPNFINAIIQYQAAVFRFDLLLPNGPIFTMF